MCRAGWLLMFENQLNAGWVLCLTLCKIRAVLLLMLNTVYTVHNCLNGHFPG